LTPRRPSLSASPPPLPIPLPLSLPFQLSTLDIFSFPVTFLPSLPDSLSPQSPLPSSLQILEHFLHHLFRLAYQAGAFGLFCVGVLDSSFLFVPLGNDFLMLGLSARHHDRVPYYVIAATIGSVCGILLTLWVSKKGGEKIKHKRGRTWKYVESQMKKNAGWSLTLGSVMPPPFPFTLFVAAAGALRVPLKKVLPYVAAGRLLRFTIEGVLAIVYGRWILSLANSPALKITMIVMIVIAIAGSAYSIVSWVRH
jgi:membrane protein YqaA with SNARE-associated domain